MFFCGGRRRPLTAFQMFTHKCRCCPRNRTWTSCCEWLAVGSRAGGGRRGEECKHQGYYDNYIVITVVICKSEEQTSQWEFHCLRTFMHDAILFSTADHRHSVLAFSEATPRKVDAVETANREARRLDVTQRCFVQTRLFTRHPMTQEMPPRHLLAIF